VRGDEREVFKLLPVKSRDEERGVVEEREKDERVVDDDKFDLKEVEEGRGK
jgi:hypothetical protein